MGAFSHRPWLWPHLLSLDAPVVALVWQAWWARSTGIELLPVHRAALGLTVWAIYLADRLADTLDPERADTRTARHRFFRGWHRPLAVLLGLVLVGLAAVMLIGGLPAADVRAGLALAAVTGGYFAWVHHRRWNPTGMGGWWKEVAVGAAFAAGTALAVRAGFDWQGWVAVGLFGVLCFANCAFITRWEMDARRGGFLRSFCGLLVIVSAALALFGPTRFPAVPVAFGAAGLRLLDGPVGAGWRPETRRVLADVVLLTPLWWLLHA